MKIDQEKAIKLLLQRQYEREMSRTMEFATKHGFRGSISSIEDWAQENGLVLPEEKQEPQHFAKFPDNHMGLFETEHMRQQLSKLEKYEAVNSTKTLKELAAVILTFADENGMIQGRTESFRADLMAHCCENIDEYYLNRLTRNWGIRQQAAYLLHLQK